MIFQEQMNDLNPCYTVGDQVGEGDWMSDQPRARPRGGAREGDAAAVRPFVRNPTRSAARRVPTHFSGGSASVSMNTFSMALALNGRNPLIARRADTAHELNHPGADLELIHELQQEIGMSVMFITHDMGVVAEIADRVVVMLKGDKVEAGPVGEIFAHPRHPYSRKLLGSVPLLGSLEATDSPRRFPAFRDTEAETAEGAVGGAEDVPLAKLVETADEPDVRGAPILEVSGLTTRFPVRGGLFGRTVGRVHAVEDVSFTLRAGETLALVGESGCGKSTTGRSILRLVEPSAGSIRFEGEELASASPAALRAARRRMQMIFQDPYGSLNPRKTVGASIREPIVVHGLARGAQADARVESLLRQVGLEPEHGLRFPHEFSGGQRQRLCIARALALEPRLIVADEAVSALDVSIKAQVVNLMLDLQRELGLAFLFISHDIAVVERVSHRVAVMLLGEIVEIGPRRAVLGDPRHPYTRKLIAAAPIPDPGRRRARAGLMTEEIVSPVRPLGWVHERRALVEVGPDHFVRDT